MKQIFIAKKQRIKVLLSEKRRKTQKIGTSARRDMERILGGQVNLKLWVKVKDDWRNSPGMLKELGFQ